MLQTPRALPSLPAAHAHAMALLARHEAGIAELAAVIESDPALTSAVLRAANSASNWAMRPIDTANEAVVRIGLEQTRRIVAGGALRHAFATLDRSGLDADEMWRHLLATALIGDATARRQGPITAAFTAGLLHDIGRLAMAAQEPGRYAEVVAAVRDGADPCDAERAAFGIDHAAWSTVIAVSWGLTEEIAAALGDHHEGAGGPLAWVVWNAREVAWCAGVGDGLLRPEAPTLDEQPEHSEILDALGGIEGLDERVNWYRGVLQA
jgi:HD-like signal output (HDOD) protein